MKRLIIAILLFVIGCIIIGVIKQEYLIHKLIKPTFFQRFRGYFISYFFLLWIHRKYCDFNKRITNYQLVIFLCSYVYRRR